MMKRLITLLLLASSSFAAQTISTIAVERHRDHGHSAWALFESGSVSVLRIYMGPDFKCVGQAMKRLLRVLAILCGSAFGAVAHVQSNQGFCSAGTHTPGNMVSGCSAVTSDTFTFTATATGDAVFFSLGCACASTTNTFSLSASGWTITQIGSAVGATGNRAAVFWAFAPNTSAATFTMSTSVSNGNFYEDLIDEFSGTDATNPVDASNTGTGTTGSCSITVTPTVANDGIRGSCLDSVTAVGSGFTVGGNDTQGDWSEWKILSGGSGVAQTVDFTGTSGAWTETAVAIKPAGGAAAPSGFNKRQKIEQLEGIR